MHTIELLMGDPSSDGHGKTATYVIESNLTRKEMDLAYEKGTEILGFDLCSDVATDYEDGSISGDYFKLLVKQGFGKKFEDVTYVNGLATVIPEKLYLDRYSFAEIFLFIVWLGNQTFTFVESKANNQIEIGGYGLFT